MCRVVRTAVMWLVAMALPLQGLAAATMLSCGAGHHRTAAAPALEQAAHDHAAHEHHAKAAPSIGHDDVAKANGADSGPTKLHQLAKFTCSACAACCVATVLPAAVVSFEPTRQTAQLVVPALSPSVTFLTAGPERPPRSLLV